MIAVFAFGVICGAILMSIIAICLLSKPRDDDFL